MISAGGIVVICSGSTGKARVTEAFICLMVLKNAGCLPLVLRVSENGVFNS